MFYINTITVEYQDRPMGVETQHPRFGWQIETEDRNWLQTAYQIRVTSEMGDLVWDSEKVVSGRADNIVYQGAPLLPCGIYRAEVTVEAQSGEICTAHTSFEMGLFDENFTGKWIEQKKHRNGWAPYFRKEFVAKEGIKRCRAYISALGCGELYLNGQKVGEDLLDPMITNYEKTVHYAAYDVTDQIKTGQNAVGVILGDGWYNQNRVWIGGVLRYGDSRLMLEIHITYEDGHVEKIVSDESFVTDFSPITLNNLYGGETYDARLEQPGWAEVGFDDTDWKPAAEIAPPGGRLTCRMMPPIRKVRKVTPVEIRNLHKDCYDGTFILDMGENFAGFVEIQVPSSPAGSEYVLRFAETVDELGGLLQTSTGVEHTWVLQQDRYITKGAAEGETWQPRFTYHGFRYVEVTGLYGRDLPENFLVGWAVNTDLATTGSFQCSNAWLNEIQAVSRRTILSNYHGVPEDCPVREKCGWLGDAQLVCEAAIYNFDMALSYEKYLNDIKTTCEVYGVWQMISPGRRTCGEASPLWGSAQVIIPWNLYLYYNDIRVLELYYDLMAKWIEHLKAKSENLLITYGLGDWCPPVGHDSDKRIPVPVSSTAEFYHCADLMAQVADILHKPEDAAYFKHLAQDIGAVFNENFLNRETHSYGTQGGSAIALAYGICPEDERDAVLKNLLYMIHEECDGAMTTGIYGNKYLAPALTEAGHGGEMLALATNPDKTSFRTMLENGATSMWEIINELPKTGSMSSLNHPMHTAFTSWFYSHILGIRPILSVPGFKKFQIKPWIFGEIDSASGGYRSAYGEIKVGWQKEGDTFRLEVTIPANTEAVLELPGKEGLCVDGKPYAESAKTDDRICLTLGSGTYCITTTL